MIGRRSLVLISLTLIAVTAGVAACDTCGGSSGPSRATDSSDAAANEGLLAGDAHGDGQATATTTADALTPCEGLAIDMAQAIGDPVCAITSGLAKSTRAVFEIAEDAGKTSLKQEAVRLDDGRVELRLVNKGTAPTTVPLSWHPKIPAFVVLADNPQEKVIYELEAPALAIDLDGGPPTARFARVTIRPGGHAFARIAMSTKVVKRAGKVPPDAGATPATIGEGKWVLHVGQLVTDVFTGAPATLPFLVEVRD